MLYQSKKSVFQHESGAADMSFVVREYLQPHFDSPFHFHDTYELIMIPRSHGKLYIDNRIVNFRMARFICSARAYPTVS